MIERLILFGATGDLAGRYLFPALAELHHRNRLPDNFEILGTARHDLSHEDFRGQVEKKLQQFASDIPESARTAFLPHIRFQKVDITAPGAADVLRPFATDDRPYAAYLALPPRAFPPAVQAIGKIGLPAGSRIVVEKPFGTGLESAKELNRLLAEVVGAHGEQAIFRVDYVLGLATVHNLLGIRFANRVPEASWNSTHIEEVSIFWDETIALEGRASYFDRTGALKDVMQNHMLQVLALIAMDPPLTLSERDFRHAKVDLLRAVRAPRAEQMRERTRRARYTAGTLANIGGAAGNRVPSYVDENGVDPKRNTETWAEIMLEVDNWRWGGTRFRLRAGKALHRVCRCVCVGYRPVPHLAFGDVSPPHNELRIGIDNPNNLSLQLTGSKPGPPFEMVPIDLSWDLPPDAPRAYSTVFLDILDGDCRLSVRGDEAEEEWRIVDPIVQAWANDEVPMEEYPAGSAGPPPRAGQPHIC